MEEEKSAKPKNHHLSAVVITVVVIVLAIILGIWLVVRADLFHKPGEIIFNETATEENRNFILSNINPEELDLESDITIGATETTAAINDPGYLLYNILLPTTDFYSTETNISASEAENLNLTSIWDLNDTQKLLSLDEKYYLDNFDSGAFFEYLTFTGETSDVEKVYNILKKQIAAFPTKDSVLTLAQTGVTALSRRMNTRLDQIGDAKYFAANIGELLSSFDLTHTSNESSFSAQANGSNICSKPAMIDALTSIGLDIVELTGNHNQDCGDLDAIATIDKYHELGIKTFGGGKTAEDAALALELNEKGSNITMLGYNYSTGGYTLDNTPGANYYTEEKASHDIQAAKERGDTVIVDVQYFECNEYVNTSEDPTCDAANSSAGDQIGFFRHLVDLGADVVVGTAAHQPQTFEQYNGGTIYYGLGNLFFDQSAWPGTTRSLILVHYFWENKLIQTRILPTVYDESFQTKLLDETAAKEFIARLIKIKPAA